MHTWVSAHKPDNTQTHTLSIGYENITDRDPWTAAEQIVSFHSTGRGTLREVAMCKTPAKQTYYALRYADKTINRRGTLITLYFWRG